MNSSETHQARPETLVSGAEREGRSSRGSRVAGAVVAGAAAVAVGAWAVVQATGQPSDSSAATKSPTATQVAAAYAKAWGSYDLPRLKSMLAGDALAQWPTLRGRNLDDKAIEFRVLLDSCE